MSSILPFPLFHGTSTLFLRSIQIHGLGAHNPVAEMDGVECLQRLQSIANRCLCGDDWWTTESISIEHMCRQSVSQGGFNFRHGGTYLSPSEQTAVRYALTNAYGSELLSACLALYIRLQPQSPPELPSVRSAFAALFALLQKKPRPILIRATDIVCSALRSESGNSIEPTVAIVNEGIASGMAALLQQSNFMLLTPLSPSCLTYWVVDGVMGDAYSPQYALSAVPKTGT